MNNNVYDFNKIREQRKQKVIKRDESERSMMSVLKESVEIGKEILESAEENMKLTKKLKSDYVTARDEAHKYSSMLHVLIDALVHSGHTNDILYEVESTAEFDKPNETDEPMFDPEIYSGLINEINAISAFWDEAEYPSEVEDE